MVDILIRQYIARLTLDDIDSFARSYGISLKREEMELIYQHIIRDWRTILYGNPRGILDDLRSKLEPFTYQKVEELYVHFKEKYQNYL